MLQVGHDNRHGFILSIQDTRRKFGKEPTKDDFIRLKNEWEQANPA